MRDSLRGAVVDYAVAVLALFLAGCWARRALSRGCTYRAIIPPRDPEPAQIHGDRP